jgi:hypothetical protein
MNASHGTFIVTTQKEPRQPTLWRNVALAAAISRFSRIDEKASETHYSRQPIRHFTLEEPEPIYRKQPQHAATYVFIFLRRTTK